MTKKIKTIEEQNQTEDEKSKSKTGDGGKSRSIGARISLKILKIVLLWIPAVIISLLIVILLALKLFLTAGRVENLIIKNFNDMSYGNISLRVTDFSPYAGFEMRDIIIKNGEEFGKTKFVEIERLVIRYNLFSMLIGNVRLEEIGIYKPRIYLTEKNGAWNAARLMKPGKPEPEEIEEEKPEEGPPTKEINLPISVEFLLKFILDDLHLYVDGSTMQSALKGLTYTMDIRVPPFKTIPKSIEAVTLLETMKLILNPQGEMDVFFSSKEAGIKTPLVFTWKLVFDRKEGERSEFESGLKLGTYRAPVRFKKTHLAPLDFSVSYDMTFNPLSDTLSLSSLDIKFRDKTWLALGGTVRRVTKKQEINIKMSESAIVLDDLYPYFVRLTGDRRTKFSGIISLHPLVIEGNPEYLDIDGEINLKGIYFKNPSTEANVQSLKLPYSVKKRSGDMKIAMGIMIPHMSYVLERDRSGDNGLELNADIASYNNFQRIGINFFNLKLFSPASGKNALYMALDGDVNLKPDPSGSINITKFTFVKEPLIAMLPEKFKKTLVSAPVNKPVDMSLGLKFALGAETKAALGMLLRVPDYNVNDLKITADVIKNDRKKRIYLNGFRIETASMGLNVAAKGTLDTQTPPFSDSDLKLNVKLNSAEMKPVYGPWKLSGLFELSAAMKGDLKTGRASGKILIDKLFVKNDESMMAVDDINMDFPFEYSFRAAGPGESRIAVSKTQIIDNDNFKAGNNFTIKSVKSKHPSRDVQFEYVKDFAAAMLFKNNAFEIVKLKAYVLDGAVYGKDILFNLADMPYTGSFKNVEYRLILDVTNVDIGYLDNPDPKAKTRNAELSLNANFSGKGLDMFIGKGKDRSRELPVSGFININKVGEDFAKKLMQGLNEHKGKSKLGIAQPVMDNFTTIKSFNFNLDMGLMYPKVSFEWRLISNIITVEDIEYDRMPIQDYLNSLLGRQ